jgi:hypothetical protein
MSGIVSSITGATTRRVRPDSKPSRVLFAAPSREGRSATGFSKIRSHMATRMRNTDAMTPRLRAYVRDLRDCKDEHEIEEQFLCYH